jgi:hypothetical protein
MDDDLVAAIGAQADWAEKARPRPIDLDALAAMLKGVFYKTSIEEIAKELKQVWSTRRLPIR